jgi:hypothetical protein
MGRFDALVDDPNSKGSRLQEKVTTVVRAANAVPQYPTLWEATA